MQTEGRRGKPVRAGYAGTTPFVVRLRDEDVHRVRAQELADVPRRRGIRAVRRLAPHDRDDVLAHETPELARKLLLRPEPRLLAEELVVRRNVPPFAAEVRVLRLRRRGIVGIAHGELSVLIAERVNSDNALVESLRLEFRHKRLQAALDAVAPGARGIRRPGPELRARRRDDVRGDAAAAVAEHDLPVLVAPGLVRMLALGEFRIGVAADRKDERDVRHEAHGVLDFAHGTLRVESVLRPVSAASRHPAEADVLHHQRNVRVGDGVSGKQLRRRNLLDRAVASLVDDGLHGASVDPEFGSALPLHDLRRMLHVRREPAVVRGFVHAVPFARHAPGAVLPAPGLLLRLERGDGPVRPDADRRIARDDDRRRQHAVMGNLARVLAVRLAARRIREAQRFGNASARVVLLEKFGDAVSGLPAMRAQKAVAVVAVRARDRHVRRKAHGLVGFRRREFGPLDDQIALFVSLDDSDDAVFDLDASFGPAGPDYRKRGIRATRGAPDHTFRRKLLAIRILVLPARRERTRIEQSARRGSAGTMDLPPVRPDGESRALAIPAAGAVPVERNATSSHMHVLEAREIPGVGNERTYLERPVKLRTKAAEPRDHKVRKRRVVVVLSALVRLPLRVQYRTGEPHSRERIEIFVNPRNRLSVFGPAHLLRGILVKELHVRLASDVAGRPLGDRVGEPREDDRRRERPARSVPLAGMSVVRDSESRRAPLGEAESERRGETLFAFHLRPGVAEARERHAEVPRRIAVQLAHRAAGAVRAHGREERQLRIPELFPDSPPKGFRLARKACGDVGALRESRDFGDGLRLAVHRAVKERTVSVASERVFASLAVVDGREHALPVSAHRERLALGAGAVDNRLRLPRFVQRDNRVEKFDRGGRIARDAHDIDERRANPGAVLHAVRAVRPEPEPRVVRRDGRVVHPPRLAQVVPRRADDRVVLSRPGDVGKELRDDPALGRLHAVAAEGAPAELVRAVDVRVRAFERGYSSRRCRGERRGKQCCRDHFGSFRGVSRSP